MSIRMDFYMGELEYERYFGNRNVMVYYDETILQLY